ncbi:BtrH N-terminal domain-containing protein [Kitasatospora sp. NPDC059673]|uniref:BtrH N-terminal domain-containing protein n=1 Tax=Kitasatospora sp. NPDC059673 TaxID=3346901 RepID=UPI0036928208
MSAPAPGSLVPWYDDLCSCLQMDIGYVLMSVGWDPVRALASGWRFTAPTGPVESVEYYHPAGERLGEQFCLYHPVELRWHRPADAASAHRAVLDALADGILPIVAVNNYHLPFRPAYHDVHAAHLLVVTGYDPRREVYRIADPMPPAYRGELPRAVLELARQALAVDDESDPFFAGSSPALRWLEVRPTGPQPELTEAWVEHTLRENLAAMRAPGDRSGPAALDRMLNELPKRAAEFGPSALQEYYVLGWPAQAEAALHATFLADAAARLERPDLAEAARWVDLVAHSWTGLRVSAAHAALGAGPSTTHVIDQGRKLLVHWEQSLQRLESVVQEAR